MVSSCNTITKYGTISICICEKCGTEFKGSKYNANRYCSYKCYHETRWPVAQRKHTKIDGKWFKGRCIDCKILIKGQYSKRCIECHEANVAESATPFYRDDISRGKYVNVHKWVYKELGKPNSCQQCGLTSSNTRRFHWANISGKYLKETSDWARLCASCHKRFDNGSLELSI